MTSPDLPILHRVENGISILILAAMAVLPLAEVASREIFNSGIPGSIPVVQHLMLSITLLGAALAARSDRNLALSTASFFGEPWSHRARVFTSFIAVGITACLFVASVQLVRIDREYGDMVSWDAGDLAGRWGRQICISGNRDSP